MYKTLPKIPIIRSIHESESWEQVRREIVAIIQASIIHVDGALNAFMCASPLVGEFIYEN